MLNLRQEIEKLLEAGKKKTPVLEPITEPDEEEAEFESLPAEDLTLDASVANVADDAISAEEDDSEPDEDLSLVEEPTEIEVETTTKAINYSDKSGIAPILRRFIRGYITDFKGLKKPLSLAIQKNFNPNRDDAFGDALLDLIVFYTDFEHSINSGIPVGVIADYVEYLKEKTPEDWEVERLQDPSILNAGGEQALKTLKASYSKTAASITKALETTRFGPGIDLSGSKGEKSFSEIEKLFKDFYIAVNIAHNYAFYKYAKVERNLRNSRADDYEEEVGGVNGEEDEKAWAASRGKSDMVEIGENPAAFSSLFKKEDKKYFSSEFFKSEGVSPDKEAFKAFLKSGSDTAKFIMSYLGTDKGLLESVNIKEYITQTLQEKAGDVGIKDTLTDNFVETMTLWMLTILIVRGKQDIFKDALYASLHNTANETAAGESANLGGVSASKFSYSVNAKDDVSGLERSEDLDNTTNLSISVEDTQYKDFWGVAEALKNLFEVNKLDTNLSSILAKVFALLPEGCLSPMGNYYSVTQSGDIETRNLFTDFKDLATTKNEGDKSELVTWISGILDFVREEDKFSYREIAEIIPVLPKTVADGLEVFRAKSANAFSSETVDNVIEDDDANTINQMFIRLRQDKFGTRSRLFSPSLTTPISLSNLKPSSYISKEFHLDVVDDNATSVSDITAGTQKNKSALSTQVVNLSAEDTVVEQDLDKQFEFYYGIVKDILDPAPSFSQEDWGLLHRTDPNWVSPNPNCAKPFVVYPIEINKGKTTVPNYVKVGSGKSEKRLIVFNDVAEYDLVKDKILSNLRAQKQNFLSAKTVEDLQSALTAVVSAIPAEKEELLAFSSPNTVRFDSPTDKGQSKYEPLAHYLSPAPTKTDKRLAQVGALSSDFWTKFNPNNLAAWNAKGNKVNQFLTFARAVLKYNNRNTPQIVQQHRVFGIDITSIFEADKTNDPKLQDYVPDKWWSTHATKADRDAYENSVARSKAEFRKQNQEHLSKLEKERTEREAYLQAVRSKAPEDKRKSAKVSSDKKDINPVQCQFAIVNLHIRAKILIAVSSVFDMMGILLYILKNLLSRLPEHSQVALKKSENEEDAKFVVDLCVRILADLVTNEQFQDTKKILTAIEGFLVDVNEHFSEVERRMKRAREFNDRIKDRAHKAPGTNSIPLPARRS